MRKSQTEAPRSAAAEHGSAWFQEYGPSVTADISQLTNQIAVFRTGLVYINAHR